jgi:hypothetical protein
MGLTNRLPARRLPAGVARVESPRPAKNDLFIPQSRLHVKNIFSFSAAFPCQKTTAICEDD